MWQHPSVSAAWGHTAIVLAHLLGTSTFWQGTYSCLQVFNSGFVSWRFFHAVCHQKLLSLENWMSCSASCSDSIFKRTLLLGGIYVCYHCPCCFGSVLVFAFLCTGPEPSSFVAKAKCSLVLSHLCTRSLLLKLVFTVSTECTWHNLLHLECFWSLHLCSFWCPSFSFSGDRVGEIQHHDVRIPNHMIGE